MLPLLALTVATTNKPAHRNAEALLLNGYKLNDANFACWAFVHRLKFERAPRARTACGFNGQRSAGQAPWLRQCITALPRYCGAGKTVSVAVALVTVLAALLTVTAKSAWLSARVVAGVVWLLPVAPAMAAPFFTHW